MKMQCTGAAAAAACMGQQHDFHIDFSKIAMGFSKFYNDFSKFAVCFSKFSLPCGPSRQWGKAAQPSCPEGKIFQAKLSSPAALKTIFRAESGRALKNQALAVGRGKNFLRVGSCEIFEQRRNGRSGI